MILPAIEELQAMSKVGADGLILVTNHLDPRKEPRLSRRRSTHCCPPCRTICRWGFTNALPLIAAC